MKFPPWRRGWRGAEITRRSFAWGDLRGHTHAQHIGEAVSYALAQIQIQHEVPVIHEVLLLETSNRPKSGASAAP